ncbi:hypothetical protein AB0N17_38405 [Streptomyces sp. NPDC051133]|uniref:hypothetical protein n=1 Tax=Streptomyces sp. NPDC051133 TaxID=3155521 RepID=UPI00343181BD
MAWDNEAAIGRCREGRAVLGHEFAALAGLLACKVILCRPRDPKLEGLVEQASGYLETSFLPGGAFTSPADFNTQLTGWLEVANRRVHRTLQACPAARWDADRAAMLPPTAPPRWWQTGADRPGPLHPPGHLRLLGRPGRDRAGRAHRGGH